MIRELIHDPIILSKKAIPATKNDIKLKNDLVDTLLHYKSTCRGMACNMIGESKAIIAFYDDKGDVRVMFNPVIIFCTFEYDTIEYCLSYLGNGTNVKRYNLIKVKFEDENFNKKEEIFTGIVSQTIQHEIDHLIGKLV